VAGTIVVGVDGSQGSKEALRWAFEEARLREARVRCVHAWVPPLVRPRGVGAAYAAALRAALERGTAALADAVAAEVDGAASVEVEAAAVEGAPAHVLTEAAQDATLLVVGSRGHGGAGRLLGSVGRQCAARARCPVVVVRSAARQG
jgi:nucleotide-binding universal stress UspA family protein